MFKLIRPIQRPPRGAGHRLARNSRTLNPRHQNPAEGRRPGRLSENCRFSDGWGDVRKRPARRRAPVSSEDPLYYASINLNADGFL